MSEIKKLIERLCPDGVEYKKLGEVLDYEQPSKYIVSSKDYLDEGIPVLTAGQTFILGYTDDDNGIYRASKDKPVIIFDDFTTSFHWVTFDFKVKSSAMKMLRPINNDINFRFIYYAMKCIKYETADHARQWISKYSLFEIPVPPIEVQSKIVEILDNFTELEAELEIKLEAELEARRKQYEYYRNQLLTFDKVGGARFDVKWMKISEVADSYTGLTYKPQNISETGKLVLRSSNIQGGVLSFDDNVYVDMQIPLRAIVKEGDVLVCVRNGSKKLVGKCAMITKEADGMAFGAFMTVLRAKAQITSKYLFHVWQSDYVKKQYYGDEGMPIAQITKSDFQRITIPIPPLEEQKRIVSILDRFEALTTDLQSGLPAEIEARRKQYEYYREQLLTFKRKTA